MGAAAMSVQARRGPFWPQSTSEARSDEASRLGLTREQAVNLGASRYLGDPCRHGHIGVRWVSNKKCVACQRQQIRESIRKQGKVSPNPQALFPPVEPAPALHPTSEKQAQRDEIERLTQEYLARGGSVEQVDHTANHSHQQPAKRTRKDQVQYLKKFGASRKG